VRQTKSSKASRGFTLVELMIVVATIGVLSSIALPEFQNVTTRSKLAERDSIMKSAVKGIEDVTLNSAVIPTNSGAFFVGAWNPDATPGSTKRQWVQTSQGWSQLPIIVDGSTYCSYAFSLNTGVSPIVLQVIGDCDIDGDGVHNVKVWTYQGLGNSFIMMPQPFGEVVQNPYAF